MDKIILNLIFTGILLLEYYLVKSNFNKKFYYSRITLLFLIYIFINSFNSWYNIINNIFILCLILYFYYKKENEFVETFTNFKKLKKLKEFNKYNLEESSLNSTNIKKKKKENFNNTDDESKSIEDYKKIFEKYKFTRPVKGSIDALNKIPYFIESFKAIWE